MTLPDWRKILPPGAALALVIGLASGIFANWAGLPLPWMLGPMIGNTIAAMARAPVIAPARLRPVVIPVIGVLLGSSITAEVLASVPGWWVAVAMLVPFLIVAAGVSYTVYRWLGGFDHVTAYYSAMPGGLAEMLILGSAAGGDERHIALAHATRILMVILFVSLFYGFALGVRTTGGGNWTPLGALEAWDWLILGLCAVVGGVFAPRLRLPAASMLGPLVLSGTAHVAGLVHVAPPTVIVILAQLVIGSIIGCRFAGTRLREILRDLGLGALASGGMIGVAVVFALAVSGMTGTETGQTFLAYSPGGLTEMSLLALAMGQEVAYVSVLHVIRILMVVAGAGLIFRLMGRRGM